MDRSETAAETKTQVETFGRVRLSPGRYTLDLSVVNDVPVKVNGELSTFGEVYCKLRDSKTGKLPLFGSLSGHRYVTDEGEIELEGSWPLLSTMRKLIGLSWEGTDPYHVNWFYYEHDWSRDGGECYDFFAICDGKFVMESCIFSSEEPLILKREIDNHPIWNSHPYFDEAWELYWYRKFYTETLRGQLMVLRPDVPILYHYERPQARDTMREVQFVTLAKIYRILWVAVPLLAALAFPSIKDYMAIAALALGVNFLWLCWTTRKVGERVG